MRRLVLPLLILSSIVLLSGISPAAEEYRAFWVDAWGAGVLKQSEVDTLMGVVGNGSSLGKIREANCNMVIVEVRRNCDANYPSSMGEPYMNGLTPSNFNSLQAVINAAHDTTGGKKRIEVHAWIVTFRTSGGAVYSAHHSTPTGSLTNFDNYWPSRTSAGAETSDKAFDPGHPLAEEYTVNVCMDLVNNFDIDGLNYDYIRFTGGDQGYNPTSIARYNARYGGLTGQPSSTDDRFDQWRRDQISNLVRKVYAKVQASKPNVKVSGSFVTWNPSPTASTREAFQLTRPYGNRSDGVFSDWDAWMEEGIVDLSIPMTYYNYASLPADWTNWMNFIKDRKFNRQAVVGPGIYLNSLSNAILELQQTRLASPSGNYAQGFCGYSYRVPYVSGTWAGFSPTLISQVTPTWADIPPMPWKTSPTKGHISGTVTDSATTKWIDWATVSITGPESRSMLTDGTGFYAFIDLIPGTYTLTASKTGYPDAVRTVDVAIGAVTGNMYVTNIPLGGTPPPTISNVQATGITSTAATITWTTDQTSSSQVEYGTTPAYGALSPFDGTLVTSHSVALSGLAPGATYHNRVISTNTNGTSTSGDYTFATPDTIPPSVPTGLSATAISGTTVNLTWTASTDNVAVTGYKVFRNSVQIGTSATPSYSDTTCTPATTYSYQVSAYDAAANESAKCTAVPATTLDTIAPSVPTNLSASAVSGTQVNLTWTASTDNVAVTGYKVFRNSVQIGTSATASYSDTTCAPVTSYTYEVSAYDAASNESAKSTSASATTPDGSAPVMTSVTDEKYTTSTTTLQASWAASEPESSIIRYEYAVGSTSGDWNVKGWTTAGTATSATISELSLAVAGTYYISVRAVNEDELVSSAMTSEGVTIAQAVDSIAEVKALANNYPVYLSARTITANFSDRLYVEEDDRFSAICVEYASAVVPGLEAEVYGRLGLMDGERALKNCKVIAGSTGTVINPLFMLTGTLGGSAYNDLTPGIPGSLSLNNLGLLVTIVGTVTDAQTGYVYVDDGKTLDDGTTHVGVRVDTSMLANPPAKDKHVVVTGICTLYNTGSAYVRMVRPRDDTDAVKYD